MEALSRSGSGPRPTEGVSHAHLTRRTAEGETIWGCGGENTGRWRWEMTPRSTDWRVLVFGFAFFTRRGGGGDLWPVLARFGVIRPGALAGETIVDWNCVG